MLIGLGLIMGLLHVLRKPDYPSPSPSSPPPSPSLSLSPSPSPSPSSPKGIWYTNSYNVDDFQTASSYCTDNGGTLASIQNLSDAVEEGWNAYCDVGYVSDDQIYPVYFSTGMKHSNTCKLLDAPGVNEYSTNIGWMNGINPPIGVYCIGNIPSNVYQSSPSTDCPNYAIGDDHDDLPLTSCYAVEL